MCRGLDSYCRRSCCRRSSRRCHPLTARSVDRGPPVNHLQEASRVRSSNEHEQLRTPYGTCRRDSPSRAPVGLNNVGSPSPFAQPEPTTTNPTWRCGLKRLHATRHRRALFRLRNLYRLWRVSFTMTKFSSRVSRSNGRGRHWPFHFGRPPEFGQFTKVTVRRTTVLFVPESTRVISKPFIPSGRIVSLVERILAMSDADVSETDRKSVV